MQEGRVPISSRNIKGFAEDLDRDGTIYNAGRSSTLALLSKWPVLHELVKRIVGVVRHHDHGFDGVFGGSGPELG